MLNHLCKTVRLVGNNQIQFDDQKQKFKDFHTKEMNEKQCDKIDKPKEELKKPHWLWDNKWFILFKKLLIAFLLLKAVTLFWNEMAKLIKAAKNVESAFG